LTKTLFTVVGDVVIVVVVVVVVVVKIFDELKL
jgi:hypothetical protein